MKPKLNKDGKPVGYELTNPDISKLWETLFLLQSIGRLNPEINEFATAFQAVTEDLIAKNGEDLTPKEAATAGKVGDKKTA